ncbi:hypothetical protein MZD04_gp226 [Pseudomonas phage Psa21]|uniref:Uncharacterized protein n=1 Tax=Pseudomonas phage Psa21 TaxID=2530023 RepID=A0A481W4Z6_9CAUD|nr:hypothetical protein MZD04_gp226 [Pseudomonas phage Psa21]QBJ02752.1 hypothetical protein PSA21_226 [Pseudomonas phage Psa21]
MTRNYFEEILPEFRTPRTHAAIHAVDGKKVNVSMWICTLENSLDKSTWFFAVKVDHLEEDSVTKSEVHFFIDERDAWIYRADRLGSKDVFFTSYEGTIQGNKLVMEGIMEKANFSERTLWDGYTLQEIRNLKA